MNCMKCNHGHVETGSKVWVFPYIWCDLHKGKGGTIFIPELYKERVCDYENDDVAPFLFDEIKILGDPFDNRGINYSTKKRKKAAGKQEAKK